jgi:hypothetical protein
MTIEDRVRRVLAEAVADEPPLQGAPLEAITRRQRRVRSLVAGAIVTALILGGVVAFAVARGPAREPVAATPTRGTVAPTPSTARPAPPPSTARPAPPPSTVPTRGWKTFTDAPGNLRFRYPPGWAVHPLPQDGAVELVPPQDADRPVDKARFRVSVEISPSFWVGEDWSGVTTRGRLPSGRAYLLDVRGPAGPGRAAAGEQPAGYGSYSIDWGRYCTSRRGHRVCGPHRVIVGYFAATTSAWDRDRAVADTIAQTATQLRPTGPSVGDQSRRACRPEQWRLVWPGEYAMANGDQRFVLQGGVQYRQGPPCHLRLTLQLAVQDKDGRPLPATGNPATTTVEGDLPEDGMQRLEGSWVIGGAFMWRFAWEEWCNRGLPVATLRVTADGGATLTVPGPRPSRPGVSLPPSIGTTCQDRGRPSTVAGWPP